jgi:hypothetical protein
MENKMGKNKKVNRMNTEDLKEKMEFAKNHGQEKSLYFIHMAQRLENITGKQVKELHYVAPIFEKSKTTEMPFNRHLYALVTTMASDGYTKAVAKVGQKKFAELVAKYSIESINSFVEKEKGRIKSKKIQSTYAKKQSARAKKNTPKIIKRRKEVKSVSIT